MSHARWLDPQEQRTWREFLWTTRLLFEALDRQLQRDAGMPHTYYLILAMLSEAQQHTLTMGALADVVRSSPSRLSHAVARLEEHGWVQRTRHSGDRRTTLARLTESGYRALAAAAPGHVAAVRRYLFDRLTREQVHTLAEAFAAVHEGLEADLSPR